MGSPLARFVLLYGALFAAFGVASPFLPALLEARGLSPEAIGAVLAAGTAIRLLTGPGGGRLADRSGAPRQVLCGFTAAAAVLALGYRLPGGFALLLAVSVLHAAVLAPLTPVADALSLGAASSPDGQRFEYGWIRGAGSAAFILGAVLAGQAVGRYGLQVVIWLNAALLGAAAVAAARVPALRTSVVQADPEAALGRNRAGSAASALLRLPSFGRIMAVAALVMGSHAMHDGFEVIRWRSAGISAAASGLLWSEAVAAEVLIFFLLGRPLLRRLDSRAAASLAAAAGVVRWGVTARTAWLPAMALVEPLHGLTFAFLHLAIMRLLARIVPPHLAATAQAFYGTVAVGAMSATLTLACGPLYDRFGAGAFWIMAGLCAAALPCAWTLPRGDR